MYLYKEGIAARSVYIVIHGELEVTKTLAFKNEIIEPVQDIFMDPLKANLKNCIYFAKNAHN